MDLQSIKNIASSLIERDQELKSVVMPEMDKMGDNEWELPASLQKMTWLIPRSDSAPRNAEIAGVRTYSTLSLNVTIERPGDDAADKKRYNQIENMISYQYMLASSRPTIDSQFFGATPIDKMLRSAIRYGEVAAQVVYLPAQLALMGDVSPSRKRAMKQYGDFAIPVYNPQNVHVRTSMFGLEGVLLKQYQTLAEFIAFWGEEKAKPLMNATNDNHDKVYVCSYDYMDYKDRAVWAALSPSNVVNYDTYTKAIDGVEIMHEEHDIPFLPWIHRGGVEPINYAVYQTGAWDAAGVAETLAFSEAIFYAASPRSKIEGPDPNAVNVDFSRPGNRVHVPPGYTYEDLKPPQINEAHVIMGDRARGDIRSMTVPSVVTQLTAEANEAAITFDQRLKSGLGAYSPFKALAEAALAEICCHMIYWPKYMGKDLSAPYATKGRDGKMMYNMDKKGKPFTLKPTETGDYDLKAKVELTPYSLVDKMQQITAATNMVQYLNYDTETAQSLLGETHPELVERKKAAEMLRQSKLQGRLMVDQASAQVEAQAVTMGVAQFLPFFQDPQFAQIAMQALTQMAQQYQMQMEGAQQQQAAPAGQEPQPNPETTQGMMGVEGQMFNAAQGGTPAATANPSGATYESQTGKMRPKRKS